MSLESSYLMLTGKGQGRLSGRGGNLSRDLKDKVKMQKGRVLLTKGTAYTMVRVWKSLAV